MEKKKKKKKKKARGSKIQCLSHSPLKRLVFQTLKRVTKKNEQNPHPTPSLSLSLSLSLSASGGSRFDNHHGYGG
jgi:hypothetical protein